MDHLSRRELLGLGLALAVGRVPCGVEGSFELQRQLLGWAADYEARRRARFAAVASPAELVALQKSLRRSFLQSIGGLPETASMPSATPAGQIVADDYVIEKLLIESFPGYLIPALLYRPRAATGRVPGVLSPCGHSEIGKAAAPYQTLHVNLARQGFAVLTYDPVGQGERSQYWDAARLRSSFNLVCGEHAVLGNPLYLLGSSLARYRIWDGMRCLDYLTSRGDVDSTKVGCVGNSGGGNLTAYLAALDVRIVAAAICCYITTLPRRMENRIEADPDSDPEQDLFGFVSEGIDHAGLLAMCAPRPTLLGTARLDFFPIEGARESFAEAKRLYEVAGAGQSIERVEAPGRHGLSRPLRDAVYSWFGRWLMGRDDPAAAVEAEVETRSAEELRVCPGGQVNMGNRSRPLLPLALEEFRSRARPPRRPLREILGLDLEGARPCTTEIALRGVSKDTLIVCVNGNEAPDWREEAEFLAALVKAGLSVIVVDPRGVGTQRPDLAVPGRDYADALSGVEANLAYNAFLLGRSVLGLRVSDTVAAVRRISGSHPSRVIVCGRRDAALVACFAAAVEPAIQGVATEEMLSSFMTLFSAEGFPINAASVLPGLLRDFGDLPDVLASIAPRRILASAGVGKVMTSDSHVQVTGERFTRDPGILTDWIVG